VSLLGLIELILETWELFILTTSVLRMWNCFLDADVQITSVSFWDYDICCLAGSAQQAQLSTHLAEGLTSLWA